MSTYQLVFLIMMLSTSALHSLLNSFEDLIEMGNTAYMSELEKEILTQGVYLQHTNEDVEVTKDLIMSFMNLCKDKYNKKLSVCFANITKFDMTNDANKNLILDFILKQGKTEKNVKLQDTFIIDDIRSITNKFMSDTTVPILDGYGFNCEVFIYELDCIPNGKFIFNYLFKPSHKFVFNNKMLCFYIALKTDICMKTTTSQSKEYYNGNKYNHYNALEGQIVFLEFDNGVLPRYVLTQSRLYKGNDSYFLSSTTSYLFGELNLSPHNAVVNINDIEGIIMIFMFNSFAIRFFYYETNDPKVLEFNEITNNKYKAQNMIKIGSERHLTNKQTPETFKYNIIFPDMIILFDKLAIQKMIILIVWIIQIFMSIIIIAIHKKKRKSKHHIKTMQNIMKNLTIW